MIFATSNKGKLSEARGILGPDWELMIPADLGITEDIPETGETLLENSIQKARYVYEKTGLDCFADDSGLEVDALGGAPGVHTARYAAEAAAQGSAWPLAGHPGADHDFDANISRLLFELRDVPFEKRTARFRTSVTLILGGKEYSFDGCLEGWIGLEKSGTRGFGYDPVFIATEDPTKTLAELPVEFKNSVSHRGKALRAMAAFLKTL